MESLAVSQANWGPGGITHSGVVPAYLFVCLSSQPVVQLGFGIYSQYSSVMLVTEVLVDHSCLLDLLVLCCSFSFTFIAVFLDQRTIGIYVLKDRIKVNIKLDSI